MATVQQVTEGHSVSDIAWSLVSMCGASSTMDVEKWVVGVSVCVASPLPEG